MKVLIVSRHQSTVSFIKSIIPSYVDVDVISHVENPDILRNYDIVIGNIPPSMLLDGKPNRYIQISLNVPKELRGKELSLEELKKYAELIEFYKIVEYEDTVNYNLQRIKPDFLAKLLSQ